MINRRSFLASLSGLSALPLAPNVLKWAAPKAEARRFSVQELNGVPTIFHYSEPILPMAHYPLTMTQKAVEDFDSAGIRFFTFHINEEEKSQSPYPAGHYPLQGGTLDEIAGYILGRSKENYLMPRVLLWEPRDESAWAAEHPGDTYLGRPSMGSEIWRATAEQHLRALIRHVEASSYRDRLIGYHVGFGTAGEWMYWGWDNPNAVDRSTATMRAYRRWLRKKYSASALELQNAWGDPTANFENAGAPTDEDLRHASLGMFIDPAHSRVVPDYYEFLSDFNAELIQYFARVVKEETRQQALYGVFFGYNIHSNFNDYRLRASAHGNLERVLETPEVDFVCSPNGYYDRNLGGMDFPQGVLTSVHAHGKVYFNEVDSWTYLSPPESPGRCGPFKPGTNTWLATPEATREVLRRNFCQALVEGSALWWMTCQRDAYWYSAPDILKNLKHMAEIHKFELGTDRRSVAQVAVVLDDRSSYYLKLDQKQNVMNPCVFSQMFELRRMGTPYDTYVMQDIVAGRVRPHNLYIFLNAFVVSDYERAALHKIFKRDHATVAWVYAAGLIGQRLDLTNMESLTGIRIRADAGPGVLNLVITDDHHDLTRRLGAGFDFDSHLHVWTSWQGSEPPQPTKIESSPMFFVEDSEATILGTLTADQKPGYAVKQLGAWRSIYLGATPAPAAAWREIARYAGAPIIDEEMDVLYADRSWLALHTDHAGQRQIHLPFRAEEVLDIFGRDKVAGSTDQFSFTAEKWKTYLFYLGPPSALPAALY